VRKRTRYTVERDMSRGYTDSTRRYIVVDRTTNLATGDEFTNQTLARKWAAHLNREAKREAS
jgi:hypothetical protein